MSLSMKKGTLVKLIVAALALFAVIFLACILRTPDGFTGDSIYYATFISLVPPIIAIGLALITKEVYSSLFIGILAGALFAANYNPVKMMDIVINDGIIGAITGQAGIFAFLVILGARQSRVRRMGLDPCEDPYGRHACHLCPRRSHFH